LSKFVIQYDKHLIKSHLYKLELLNQSIMLSISLGDDCAVANAIKGIYMPFDWCLTKNLSVITQIFEDDFAEFTNWENWSYDTTQVYDRYFNEDDVERKVIKTHMLIYNHPANSSNSANSANGVNNVVRYPHNITISNPESDFAEFKVKMMRRIMRLREIPAVQRTFYRYESNSIKNITVENVEKILKHCSQFKIWLNPNEYNRLIIAKDNRFANLQKYIDSGQFHIMIDENWQSYTNWQKELLI
jgi:hypothetical protein